MLGGFYVYGKLPSPMETVEPASPRPRLTPGFLGIIVFKYVKCAAFLLVGGVVLRIAHVSARSGPMMIARAVGVEETRVTIRDLASLLSAFTPGQVQALGLAAILIGLVFGVEGTCLALRIWWAPYFTILLTAAAHPRGALRDRAAAGERPALRAAGDQRRDPRLPLEPPQRVQEDGGALTPGNRFASQASTSSGW